MAFTYGFYNSIGHDRKYRAEDMANLFDGLITEGVFETIDDKLSTVPGGGMSVLVKPGKAWFDRTWSINDADYLLEVDPADVSLTRIDAVVLETNKNESIRANSLKMVKGTAATTPSKPTLVRNDVVNQHALAYITVTGGLAEIGTANISIVVGMNECPYVTGLVEHTSVEDLFQTWNGEFETWFEGIKELLDGDVVGNLLNEINNCVQIDDKATTALAVAGTDDSHYMTPKSTLSSIEANSVKVGDIVITDETNFSNIHGFEICDGSMVIGDPGDFIRDFNSDIRNSLLVKPEELYYADTGLLKYSKILATDRENGLALVLYNASQQPTSSSGGYFRKVSGYGLGISSQVSYNAYPLFTTTVAQTGFDIFGVKNGVLSLYIAQTTINSVNQPRIHLGRGFEYLSYLSTTNLPYLFTDLTPTSDNTVYQFSDAYGYSYIKILGVIYSEDNEKYYLWAMYVMQGSENISHYNKILCVESSSIMMIPNSPRTNTLVNGIDFPSSRVSMNYGCLIGKIYDSSNNWYDILLFHPQFADLYTVLLPNHPENSDRSTSILSKDLVLIVDFYKIPGNDMNNKIIQVKLLQVTASGFEIRDVDLECYIVVGEEVFSTDDYAYAVNSQFIFSEKTSGETVFWASSYASYRKYIRFIKTILSSDMSKLTIYYYDTPVDIFWPMIANDEANVVIDSSSEVVDSKNRHWLISQLSNNTVISTPRYRRPYVKPSPGSLVGMVRTD